MEEQRTDAATEAFVAHRNLLFTVAYEMLGSAADAEDVMQETWLRWMKVDVGQVQIVELIVDRRAPFRLPRMGTGARECERFTDEICVHRSVPVLKAKSPVRRLGFSLNSWGG